MENTPIKPRLLDLLRHARADEQALVAGLSEADHAATGTLERWSPKDLVAHLAAWRQRLIDRLAAALRGETPPSVDELDEINAAIFEKNRERSWPEVLAEAERVFAGLVAQLDPFTEEDLTDPNRYPWRKGDPLYLTILGPGFLHPETHLVEFYRERGDLARAEQIQRAMAETVGSKLSDSPRMRGLTLYNLACFYATTGQPDKALPLLRESLPLHPRLVEWSQQDPDLASLRDLPAYQALYAAST